MPITCNEAVACGLVLRHFDKGSVLSGTIAIAVGLSKHSGTAIQLAIKAVCRGEDSVWPGGNDQDKTALTVDHVLCDNCGRDVSF